MQTLQERNELASWVRLERHPNLPGVMDLHVLRDELLDAFAVHALGQFARMLFIEMSQRSECDQLGKNLFCEFRGDVLTREAAVQKGSAAIQFSIRCSSDPERSASSRVSLFAASLTSSTLSYLLDVVSVARPSLFATAYTVGGASHSWPTGSLFTAIAAATMGGPVDDDDPVARVTAGGNGAGGFDDTAVAAAAEALACATVTLDGSAVAAAFDVLAIGDAGDEGDHKLLSGDGARVVTLSTIGSLAGDKTRAVTLRGLALVASEGHCPTSRNVRSRFPSTALATMASRPICQTGVVAFEAIATAGTRGGEGLCGLGEGDSGVNGAGPVGV
jgi:hypothetical protein